MANHNENTLKMANHNENTLKMANHNEKTLIKTGIKHIDYMKNGQRKCLGNSYSLLLNLSKYKKQITSLAIGCIKRQNLHSSTSHHEQSILTKKTYLKGGQNVFAAIPQLRAGDVNIEHTKKKKYNYGISLKSHNNQMNDGYDLAVQLSTKKHYDYRSPKYEAQSHDNSRNHSFLSKHRTQYITQPFLIDRKLQDNNFKHCSKEPLLNNSRDVTNMKQEYKIFSAFQMSPHHKNKNHSQMGLLEHQRNKQIIGTKQRAKQQINNNQDVKVQYILLDHRQKNIQKIGGNQRKQKGNIKNEKRLSNKTLNRVYPKTEIYTSRSQYNLDRLTSKLDSYINKHIK